MTYKAFVANALTKQCILDIKGSLVTFYFLFFFYHIYTREREEKFELIIFIIVAWSIAIELPLGLFPQGLL
jgi:hypothetical protein